MKYAYGNLPESFGYNEHIQHIMYGDCLEVSTEPLWPTASITYINDDN